VGIPLKSDLGSRIKSQPALATVAGKASLLTDTAGMKISVCPAAELPPGGMRLVEHDGVKIGVFNCDGAYYAIEDRCSHDNGPLAEGEFDTADCTVECPRHGSLFDLTTGRPKTLPAFQPVQTFPVAVEDDTITLEVN
jgi:3-phenylpropionate/trans-cinnamate dioxygenase ferredoxin component